MLDRQDAETDRLRDWNRYFSRRVRELTKENADLKAAARRTTNDNDGGTSGSTGTTGDNGGGNNPNPGFLASVGGLLKTVGSFLWHYLPYGLGILLVLLLAIFVAPAAWLWYQRQKSATSTFEMTEEAKTATLYHLAVCGIVTAVLLAVVAIRHFL